jgi:hypothetical protein
MRKQAALVRKYPVSHPAWPPKVVVNRDRVMRGFEKI